MPHLVLPDKYKIPVPTKDDFPLGLYIPCDHSIFPYVVSQHPEELISQTFQDSSHSVLYTFSGYHIYYDKNLQWTSFYPNKIVTSLLRNDLSCSLGKNFTDSVNGDVLLFSSYKYFHKEIIQGDYTVPYEILEQVSRLYDIYKNN